MCVVSGGNMIGCKLQSSLTKHETINISACGVVRASRRGVRMTPDLRYGGTFA